MKNYYEILEVDKNASAEVIEKAYKTLAKKYHPDLQQGEQKYEAAEKMKIINQAYDVLSDNAKREEYNQRLEAQRIEEDRRRAEAIARQQQERVVQQNYQQRQQVDEGTIINMSRMLEQQMRAARNQAYHDAYIEDLKNRGYKIKYKHDFKYYLKAIKVIAIIIIACFLIYQLPFVKNFFTNLYEENTIFQVIINIFKNTFSSSF